jgi:hypothetical protein
LIQFRLLRSRLVSLLNSRFTHESVEHPERFVSNAARLFDGSVPDLWASWDLSGNAFCPDNLDPIGIVRVGVEVDDGWAVFCGATTLLLAIGQSIR